MKFLYPEFLWAFAVLLIPIIIHLFNFKRYKTLYFSSLQFVKQVDQKTKSIQKLKHYLILASRLLAFIFLVLAFAQPYFNETIASGSSNAVILHIDNSFSMQAQGIEGELLSEARESARSLIEKSPRGTQFIIGTNELSGAEQRKLNQIEALEKIDQIDYSPIVRSLDDISSWLHETIQKNELSDSSQLVKSVLLGDFQASSTRNANTEISLKNVAIYPIQFIPEKTGNLTIDSVWFSTPIRRVSTTNEFFMRVKNNSDEDLQKVEISIQIDRFNKSFYTDIPANQEKITSITYSDKTTGFKSGSVTVADDHVHFDDTYFLSYEVKEKSSILILNAEDAISNVGIALQLEPFYQVQETPITSITLDDFKGKDLVIVNGANSMPSGIRKYLIDFRDGGGALALFPGKSAVKPEWNSILSTLKLPSLGADVSSGTRCKSLNENDIFVTGLLDGSADNLNLPGVSKAYQALTSGSSNFIPLMDLQNGLPILAYSKGKSNAYMFYSSLHPDWGNISKDALFPTMLLRIGELSQRTAPLSLTIGKSELYPIYSQQKLENAIHVNNDQFDFIPPIVEKFGINYISLDQAGDFKQLQAGNFDLNNGSKLGELSINYNRIESKLMYYNERSITDYFTNIGVGSVSFKAVDGIDSPLNDLEIDKPFSYWKICIILTLIFVISEMLLVRFLKQ